MIATFYALPDVAGRDRTAAATARALSSWGHRTLCVDWDPTAELTAALLSDRDGRPGGTLVDDLIANHPHAATAHVVAVDSPAPGSAPLGLVPAGASGAADRDWAALYRDHRLGDLLEGCRAEWSRHYDVVLVACPTGTSGAAAICLAQLAEVVVALAPNTPSAVHQLVDIVRRADAARDRLPYGQAQLAVLPLLPRGGAHDDPSGAAALVQNWINRRVPADSLLRGIAHPDGRPEASAQTVAALLARGLGGTRHLVDDPESYRADAHRARLREAEEIRADVAASLDGLGAWELELSSWSEVEDALRDLWEALDTGDVTGLEHAAIDLERASSTSRTAGSRAVGIPPRVAALGRELRGFVN